MSAFSEYVTSTAFYMRLPRSQIMTLARIASEHIRHNLRTPRRDKRVFIRALSKADVWDLARKGLIVVSQGQPDWYQLTRPGELTAHLLVCAGLIEERELIHVRYERDDLASQAMYDAAAAE